jgi:hypothetical protein
LVGKNLTGEQEEESMRATGQKYLEKAEKAQAKRNNPPPPKTEEEDDDDDEMPLLEDQEGNVLTEPGSQADSTPTDQEAEDLWNKIKGNLEGDTAGDAEDPKATEENIAPTSSKPSVEDPDFQDDFEDQPQGLLDKLLGRKPESKYVGGETDPEVELQTKADQAQQKAEGEALRNKYKPPPKGEEDFTPDAGEENPFLFDKSLFSDNNTTSAEASENFVKNLSTKKDYIPPSQQTEGQDATKVADDAGYNRGQQKILAKVEEDDFEESGQDNNPFPPPKAEDLVKNVAEPVQAPTQTDTIDYDPKDLPPPVEDTPIPPPAKTDTIDYDPKDLPPPVEDTPIPPPAKTDTIDYDPKDLPPPVEDTPIPPPAKTDTIDYDPKDLPPPVEDTPIPPPAPAPPPVVQAPPVQLQQTETNTAEPINNDIQEANRVSSTVDSEATAVSSGLKKTETITQDLADTTVASTAEDENPIGDIITAGLGLATLLSPLFSSPTKVQPTQYLNPSSQFGA